MLVDPLGYELKRLGQCSYLAILTIVVEVGIGVRLRRGITQGTLHDIKRELERAFEKAFGKPIECRCGGNSLGSCRMQFKLNVEFARPTDGRKYFLISFYDNEYGLAEWWRENLREASPDFMAVTARKHSKAGADDPHEMGIGIMPLPDFKPVLPGNPPGGRDVAVDTYAHEMGRMFGLWDYEFGLLSQRLDPKAVPPDEDESCVILRECTLSSDYCCLESPRYILPPWPGGGGITPGLHPGGTTPGTQPGQTTPGFYQPRPPGYYAGYA